MNMPAFTANASLYDRQKPYFVNGNTYAIVGNEQILPQQLECFNNCHAIWLDCINTCSWWEWLTGYCPPKCRYIQGVCLANCL